MDVHGCEKGRVRQEKRTEEFVHTHSTHGEVGPAAVSPVHGHVHQVTKLDASRDVPFSGLMHPSSASCVW